MNIENIREKLSFLNDKDDLFCEIYTLVGNNLKKIKLEDNASKKLSVSFSESILEKFDNEIRIKSIEDFDDEDAKAIYYFDESNLIDDLKILINLPEEIEEVSNINLNEISFILIKLGINDEKSCILYKKLSPIHLLKQSLKVSFLSLEQGMLKEYDKNLLKLDNNFHFLLLDDKVFVLNFNILEKNFKYNDVILQKAQLAIEKLETIEILEDLQKIKELSNDKSFAKKIFKIDKSDVIRVLKEEPQKVINFITNHEKLKNFFEIKDGKIRLKKQTKKHAEKLIKLLNDDFIQSELTNIMYETLNKERLE